VPTSRGSTVVWPRPPTLLEASAIGTGGGLLQIRLVFVSASALRRGAGHPSSPAPSGATAGVTS
jgi:hypothetical protein